MGWEAPRYFGSVVVDQSLKRDAKRLTRVADVTQDHALKKHLVSL
jgi:hypothetical protein